jgi:glutamate/tyrosine decarboxylase-like PLP-dependent enzyme
MIATAFMSPSFNYAVSPSHTELENIMVDWSVQAMNLPKKFLICNTGGGVIIGSATESLFLAVHAAKISKINERKLQLSDPEILKLVGYYSETTHIATARGLLLKDIAHRRDIPCYMDKKIGNYIVDLVKFREIV